MKKVDWENLRKEHFRRLFKDSPVKRTKYEGLKRNIKFVAGSYE
jgi:epoxyqueuosine reductase